VIATNSTTSGAVQLTGRARVHGNMLIGPTGNPSSVVTTSGNSAVTGTVTAASSRQALFRPTPPTAPATSGAYTLNSGTVTINSSRRYTTFSLNNAATVTIQGHVHLHIDDDVTLTGSSRITLAANSSLTMWVGGDVNVNGTASINSGGTSSHALIVMTANGATYEMTDQTVVHAHVLNPRGSVLVFGSSNNASSLQGVVRGDRLEMNDKTQIHGEMYVVSGGGSGGGISILSWGESP
jgi:hypothetical protein